MSSKVLVIGFREFNKFDKFNISRLHKRELFLTSEIQDKKDKRIKIVKEFLESKSRMEELEDKKWKRFIKYVSRFFIKEEWIWRQARIGYLQVVVIDLSKQ